jgi:lathosterol oxidase
MDIALEFLDTFVFDYFYAALLPVRPAPYILGDGLSNSTMADIKAASPWVHHSTTQFLSLEPRDAAYLSQWNRDNPYRQLLSLFFITWLVVALARAPRSKVKV